MFHAIRVTSEIERAFREKERLLWGLCYRLTGSAADADDLAHFLSEKPADVPVFVLGVGSNLLVRDGGLRGTVVFTHGVLADIRVPVFAVGTVTVSLS